mgnify:FL=1
MNKLKDLDLEKLDKALDNPFNDEIENLNYDKIQEMNIKIINELHLSKKDAVTIAISLKDYLFIDELSDIKDGRFVKWINLDDPVKLKQGGIICGYEIGNEGVYLKCKNFKNRFFSLSLEKNLVFQKLSNQEIIIINALKLI